MCGASSQVDAAHRINIARHGRWTRHERHSSDLMVMLFKGRRKAWQLRTDFHFADSNAGRDTDECSIKWTETNSAATARK